MLAASSGPRTSSHTLAAWLARYTAACPAEFPAPTNARSFLILRLLGAVYAVAFSLDGKTLATGSLDRTVGLWDPATGKLLRRLTGHDEAVQAGIRSLTPKMLAGCAIRLLFSSGKSAP